MYAFYSLLVYIIYTFFRRKTAEGQDEDTSDPSNTQNEFHVSGGTETEGSGRITHEDRSTEVDEVSLIQISTWTESKGSKKTEREELFPELDELNTSSDSDGVSEDEDPVIGTRDQSLQDISSPLTEFLAFKQETSSGRSLAGNEESLKAPSPLLTVMSHLITFLEHYSQMQRLQGKAQEYRHQLQQEERRRRKQIRSLRGAYRQRMRDKLSLIGSLETVIYEQQSVLEKLQNGTISPLLPISPLSPIGVHKLVESISALQGERTRLMEEIEGLKQDIEEKERENQELSCALQHQIEHLKEKIQEREDEVSQLRVEMGVTDSEKRLQNLTVENQCLKQNLGVTQGLLEKMATVSAQPSAQLVKGTSDNPGINQRALQALYKEMEARGGLWNYSVSVSMVEIYNEVIRDLLSKEPQEKLDIKLNPDGSGQLHVPGLTSREVSGFRHIKKLLSLGKRNRATFCTNMNERSSRSHALLTITITGKDLTTGTVTTGKLNLVDLAGSERVWKSGAEGERLKEAQNINKSLLALGEVIQALRAKQGHVPFRNSKLTYMLQDSLGKGNKTVMMVQVSPLEENIGETVCSLKFAQRVCKVELGPASRRIDTGAIRSDM
ncbi:uncharacterized protein WCC33_010987 [Rhinophrynus dorsalis]